MAEKCGRQTYTHTHRQTDKQTDRQRDGTDNMIVASLGKGQLNCLFGIGRGNYNEKKWLSKLCEEPPVGSGKYYLKLNSSL